MISYFSQKSVKSKLHSIFIIDDSDECTGDGCVFSSVNSLNIVFSLLNIYICGQCAPILLLGVHMVDGGRTLRF